MLRSYLKIAFRAIQRHPGNTVINVAGLSIGMASFILITLFVQDQLRYDDFHDRFGQDDAAAILLRPAKLFTIESFAVGTTHFFASSVSSCSTGSDFTDGGS